MLQTSTAAACNNGASLTGVIEKLDVNQVLGWAIDLDRPDIPLHIDIKANGVTIGSGIADIVRQDLRRAGVGHGNHGFCITVDIPFYSGQQIQLELYTVSAGVAIAASPFTLHCRDPLALHDSELDARGVHGLVRPRQSKRRRQFAAVFSTVFARIRRARNHYAKKNGKSTPAGVMAKLTRVDSMSLTTIEKIENWPTIKMPSFDSESTNRPNVSVIIPAHNQFQLTYQCLVSLVLSGDTANIEFMLVDDASTDATSAIESCVENLRVIRNETNLGFLRSCNKAAALANGQYIVFLNNDTEVESLWIDHMLSVFSDNERVGAVGAKLVYPDGLLQDAGGIVWESGQPWNVGHGKHRDDPEYNYVREVDYLTGAALMVSKDAWQTVDGFSEQYAPAYYEDTDLAFKLRDAGFRTLYCPQSAVVHYEGRSNGTDTGQGVKQHQVLNAEHFKATWKQHFSGLGAEGVDLRLQKDRNRGLRVLMVDNSFPRLGHDAGSYAAVQEMKLLISLGCKVTFLPHNLLHLGIHVDCLQRLGVECVHSPFHRSVAKFFERRGDEFDVVYITRYVVAEKIIPLVRQYSQAKVIFNNADLHFLREMRTAKAVGTADFSAVNVTRERELAVMNSADVVLSYSDIELEIISTHLLTSRKLFRCPWVLREQCDTKSREERRGFVFLGGFAHPPNRFAMDWFISNVMPILNQRRPELTLHIWGSQLPDGTGWDQQPGVVLEGYAQSLDQVFNSAMVFIAPLQSGAGIKGKVLDSLAYGVPTVLSSVAAEATGLIDGNSTLIAQTPEQWALHIESLMDDELLWQHIRNNAIVLRDKQYSLDAGIESMHAVFDFLELDTTIAHQQVTQK